MDPSDPFAPPPDNPSASLSGTAGGGNLPLAAVAGLAAAIAGAILWALLVSATNIKIGFAAVGVGFLVGWTMRKAGRGHSPVYGYTAAVLALIGCVIGDVLTDCVGRAEFLGRPSLEVISQLTPAIALDMLQKNFQPLDALFYFLAVSAAYRNAFYRD